MKWTLGQENKRKVSANAWNCFIKNHDQGIPVHLQNNEG